MTEQFSRTCALIGAGYWGKNLARNFDALGALHTICDTDRALLDSYREKYPEAHLTTDFTEVLKNPEIKQVAIAAPAVQHYELAKQALLADKDIYVEKPLCLDSAEAKELIHIADEQDCLIMVGHLLQYHPCVRKLQELVENGDLGKIQYITSNRLNLGSYRTEENALWNFAPHDVSVILSLCGRRLPEKVRCTGASYLSKGIADKTLTTLKFAGDVQAHIYVSWLNPFKEQKMTVVGSQGLAVFDDTKPWNEKLVLFRGHVNWSDGKRPVATQPTPENVAPPQLEPLKEECRHFLSCCLSRKTPLTDGEEGLRVLQVLQAAQESLEEDGEAKVPSAPHVTFGRYSLKVHPTATIDPGADIGAETSIWHYTHISEKSKVGSKCRIGQNVFIAPEAVIGDNVKVQNNVSVYSGVVCENDVFLGPGMVFTNIKNPRSEVVRRDKYVKTLVKKGATIGANATILCGIRLGEYCFIGAGAVVVKDVKPFALMVGSPARQVGWMSRHGEKLELPLQANDGESLFARCPATGETYCLEFDQVRPAEEELAKVKR
jgi:UDP-2-acetamido-3-amino-2,3-dideoxy-glucuronate N-acetyltransferase